MFNCISLEDYLNVFKNYSPALSEHRIEHMTGVAYTSASLAMCYGENVKKAWICGLLHDIAKGYNDEELVHACQKYSLPISKTELECPFLLHGKVGAHIAENDFGINDRDMLDSIKYHVTGIPGMSELCKIVYIADFIEPGRGEADCFVTARNEAFKGLDRAVAVVSGLVLDHLSSRNRIIDENTVRTYDYYKSVIVK